MKWKLNFSVGSKNYSTEAEIIYTSHQIEDIRVKGDGIMVVLQNNRPLLTAIELKKPLTWKLIEGEVKDMATYNMITQKLEAHLATKSKSLI